jgi:hypothetical protein
VSESTKKYLAYGGVALVAMWVVFVWPHTFSWDGDGTINAFPFGASAKNYRLEASIGVTRHKNGWIHNYDEYEVRHATWPNGGDMEIEGCVVKEESRSLCTDQNGKEYWIEVDTYPDPPESNYDDNY